MVICHLKTKAPPKFWCFGIFVSRWVTCKKYQKSEYFEIMPKCLTAILQHPTYGNEETHAALSQNWQK